MILAHLWIRTVIKEIAVPGSHRKTAARGRAEAQATMDPMTSMIIADLVTTTTAVAETSEAPVVAMRIHSIADSPRGPLDPTATGNYKLLHDCSNNGLIGEKRNDKSF